VWVPKESYSQQTHGDPQESNQFFIEKKKHMYKMKGRKENKRKKEEKR
jgi:hypothetical protein